MPLDGGTIGSQVGAAMGLWTHTPVDWRGNETGVRRLVLLAGRQMRLSPCRRTARRVGRSVRRADDHCRIGVGHRRDWRDH